MILRFFYRLVPVAKILDVDLDLEFDRLWRSVTASRELTIVSVIES